MKLLVTGGAGFIGSNFVHYWLKNHPNDTLVNVDKLTYAGHLSSLKDLESNPNYKFVQADIRDSDKINELVKDVDTIVHFAAESHVDRSITGPAEFVLTNVLGTQVLLDAAKNNGMKRFHHISTDEVFGSLQLNDGKKFDENTPYAPHSPYSASKAGSDHLVRAYFDTFDLPVTITNCSNNYGPYHHPEKLIPLAITNLLTGKKVPVYGDGLNVRDWLFVEDHCSAIETILEKGKVGETYCVGGDSEIPNIQVVKTILEKLGKDESSIEYVADRLGHDKRYAIDHSKLTSELGWNPKVTFAEGISKTVDWYKENESWWKDILSGK